MGYFQKIKNYFKRNIFKALKKIGFQIYTKKQKRILNKKIIFSSSNLDSIIFFTTHKCASNFSQLMLKEIEKESGYILFDYGSLLGSLTYELKLTSNFEKHLNLNHSNLFQLFGELYGPQRKPLNFQGIENFKKIFFLRDPRDVLISAYYSFGFTHPEPLGSNILDNFISERAEIIKMSIDEYVLKESANWIKPMYTEYMQLKESSKGKTLFVSYNKFINSRHEFFNQIFDFCNVRNEFLINKMITESNPVQVTEDTSKHQRSGKIGQWEEKLNKSTISKLNNELSEIIKYWEFD